MADIDAKVNMSLDEIIKLEKKEKKNRGIALVNSEIRRNGGAKMHIQSGRQALKKKYVGQFNKLMVWKQLSNKLRGGFIRKRYNKKGGIIKSQSSLALNQNFKTNTRGAFNQRSAVSRRSLSNKIGLKRIRNQTGLSFGKSEFFTNTNTLKRTTNNMSNSRDPNSVYNRLGYQSPAQIAYRNRVKRAKQLLLQKQNRRMNLQNEFKMTGALKSLSTLHQKSLERRQQILSSQPRFSTGGLRSDQIIRSQRRAFYEQKLMRFNPTPGHNNSNINFTCTLRPGFYPKIQQSLDLGQRQKNGNMNIRQLPRGRSPFRPNVQNQNTLVQSQQFSRQRRSRSRSRTSSCGFMSLDSSLNVDDRSFSEVMYSLSGNLGVTGRTLNDRFSF